jgi:hypothetical protein
VEKETPQQSEGVGCDVHVGWASLVGVVVVSVRVWDFAWVCVRASACVRVACGVWCVVCVCACVRDPHSRQTPEYLVGGAIVL